MMACSSARNELRKNPVIERDGVDDHHARRAVHVPDRRAEVAHPHHVEEDVQRAAVQPARAEQRPPAPMTEDRRARRTRPARYADGRFGPRMREDDSAEEVAARHHGQQQRTAYRSPRSRRRSGGREAEVVAEPPQHRSEPPETRIPAPARVALVVVHPDQRAARGADDGAGFLTEHQETSLSDGLGDWEWVIFQDPDPPFPIPIPIPT